MQTTSKKFTLESLVRKNIRALKPYSSARDEFTGAAEVFLDANENPYPSPFNRYPDPLQQNVKERLAVLKKVSPENIFLGNGSDEAIDLVIRAFCEPRQDSILITDPTYGMYAVCAGVNDVTVQRVSLTPDFDLNLDAIAEQINATTKVIFLCSPNNPTGNLLSRNKIEKLIEQFRGLVVLDEAYMDFASGQSFVERLSDYPNLVVLQTFSKAWGLAGLRLGIAYAADDIISVLNKIKYPYNINIQTQELVLKALEKAEIKNRWVEEILKQREILRSELANLRITEKIYPSDANFILVKIKNAHRVYRYLMDRKIIVRDRSRVTLCENCLRITVGTPDENNRLLLALKEL